jgi:hypothetical protein
VAMQAFIHHLEALSGCGSLGHPTPRAVPSP